MRNIYTIGFNRTPIGKPYGFLYDKVVRVDVLGGTSYMGILQGVKNGEIILSPKIVVEDGKFRISNSPKVIDLSQKISVESHDKTLEEACKQLGAQSQNNPNKKIPKTFSSLAKQTNITSIIPGTQYNLF